MKKYRIGFTQGTYDMFHVGHLNLLLNAKAFCEYLIVGVNTDDLVESYKGKTTVISVSDRARIIENIKCVDRCVICDSLDKNISWEKYHFDALFIGDDWKGTSRWIKTEQELSQHGVEVVYLPHTDGISSTMLREKRQAINKID